MKPVFSHTNIVNLCERIGKHHKANRQILISFELNKTLYCMFWTGVQFSASYTSGTEYRLLCTSCFILVLFVLLISFFPIFRPTLYLIEMFAYLFSIKFLYFFTISSLVPYFNLFVSIFIQSYVNSNLHLSTLYIIIIGSYRVQASVYLLFHFGVICFTYFIFFYA
jgi:hypothetical protein